MAKFPSPINRFRMFLCRKNARKTLFADVIYVPCLHINTLEWQSSRISFVARPSRRYEFIQQQQQLIDLIYECFRFTASFSMNLKANSFWRLTVACYGSYNSVNNIFQFLFLTPRLSLWILVHVDDEGSSYRNQAVSISE